MTDSRINWYNLTAEERASLTEEQVRDYCRVAAMEAGVVLATPIEETFLDETEPSYEVEPLWVVQAENMPEGIAFASHADAKKFMDLNVIGVMSKYLGSGWAKCVKVIRPLTGMVALQHSDFIREDEYAQARTALDEYGDAVTHNEELRRKKNSREREYSATTKYVWDDYREAQNRRTLLSEIRECWAEYQDLAKDQESAVKFMVKAYEHDLELVGEALGANWNIIEATEA